MRDPVERRPIAGWFVPAALLSLLLMILPLVGAIVHLTTDPATLALDERALFEAEPLWRVAAFGLAGLAGSAGALMLLLRRRLAEPLLAVSLMALVLWFAGLFVAPRLRALVSADQIAVALAVLAIGWTIFWFARHSRQRGWLS